MHERPQKSFLGWANHFLDWAKHNFNNYHFQFPIQSSYFVPKISQMSNSWTGQVPSLAHWCGRPCLGAGSLVCFDLFICLGDLLDFTWVSSEKKAPYNYIKLNSIKFIIEIF